MIPSFSPAPPVVTLQEKHNIEKRERSYRDSEASENIEGSEALGFQRAFARGEIGVGFDETVLVVRRVVFNADIGHGRILGREGVA